MTLTDKIWEELKSENPQLLEDIQTFTNMVIPREQIVINPDTYGEQLKRLDQHRKDNEANLTNFINRNIGKVIETLIQDLSTFSRSYSTTSSDCWIHTDSSGDHTHSAHTHSAHTHSSH
jgi:hypothetical protein